jgi:RNA ligase
MTEPIPKQRHPAWTMPFADLIAGLHAAREDRAIYPRDHESGLQLWNYTDKCVYDKLWTPITVAARGLILDLAAERIVATPFPKFFNLGERLDDLPNEPFEVFEKVDGSLIIIFHHDGQWKTSTRGAFDTPQALWAADMLLALNTNSLQPGTTYLAEAVYPENRIVIAYDRPELVLLSAYGDNGFELDGAQVAAAADALGTRAALRHQFASVHEIVEKAAVLPRSEEGYILRFVSGHRVKIKGAEYRRIHALISRVTPLAIWEMLANDHDLDSIRRDIPEEFWTDYDEIRSILEGRAKATIDKIAAFAAESADLSDKDIGLQRDSLDPDVRKFIFVYRRFGPEFLAVGKNRDAFWRNFRPTGNELEGYVPSHAMSRILEEA